LSRRRNSGFTLVELLVSIAILTMLIGILIPGLSRARKSAKATVCKTRLATIGKGLTMYTDDNEGQLMPGRMPKVDEENWAISIEGGKKYRPTFLAMMGSYIGIQPFAKNATRAAYQWPWLELGDRQNYVHDAYLCPVVDDWVDERNGAYGYNYQFLGNARLRIEGNPYSFKNWPVPLALVKAPSECVAVGDSLGTAAAFGKNNRMPYEDDGGFIHPDQGRTPSAMGNEGFNLDPPKVVGADGSGDGETGEMALMEEGKRSAVDERHLSKCNILWLDGHCSPETYRTLGYVVDDNRDAEHRLLYGRVMDMGESNKLWHSRREDVAWTMPTP